MPFIVLTIVRDGSSKPIKDWFGCSIEVNVTLSEVYDEFFAGKFDGESLNDEGMSSFSSVFVGTNKVEMTKVSPTVRLADAVGSLGSFIKFVLAPNVDDEDTDLEPDPRPRPKNAFVLLMEGSKNRNTTLPPEFTDARNTSKVRLKNDLRSWLASNSVGWSADSAQSLGVTFINTLADALWYIDQNHHTLQARGCVIPQMFLKFKGYRCPEKQKKRKIDASNLKQDELKAHSSALFNLSMASYIKQDS